MVSTSNNEPSRDALTDHVAGTLASTGQMDTSQATNIGEQLGEHRGHTGDQLHEPAGMNARGSWDERKAPSECGAIEAQLNLQAVK